MFEDFGFVYLGPVDGHDLPALERTLKTARSLHKPVLVHVNTVKGKGYRPAEENPGAYHGIGKMSMEVKNPEIISDDSYSAVFGKELCRLAESDSRICAVTAAMKYGTGLQYFSAKHKDRFFDVGIAEQHAVTFCAGLAKSGMIPVFAVYSSFLQRAYDQVLHDCAISGNHVVLAVDRAGIVGEDGETHQGLFDIPFLTSVPGMTIYSPGSYEELKECLYKAVYEETGVVCVRYPRGAEQQAQRAEITKSKGESIGAVSYGRIFSSLQEAAKGLPLDIYKMTKVFPIEESLVLELLTKKSIVFFEEGMRFGGIGEHLLDALEERGWQGRFRIVAPEGFVRQAAVDSALKKCGLDASSMKKILTEEIEGA